MRILYIFHDKCDFILYDLGDFIIIGYHDHNNKEMMGISIELGYSSYPRNFYIRIYRGAPGEEILLSPIIINSGLY